MSMIKYITVYQQYKYCLPVLFPCCFWFSFIFPNVSPALNTDIWIVLHHPGYLVFEGEIFSPADINPS